MTIRKSQVLTGLDVLVRDDLAPLRGRSIALLAHAASVDRDLRNILDIFLENGLRVVRVFGPEHGFWAVAQDMEPVGAHPAYAGIEFVSLYGTTEESLTPRPEHFEGVDLLVCDLLDVGSRYYTFVNSVVFAVEAAARAGVESLVLDRPNPLGGVHIEGPLLEPGYGSFVGLVPVPVRHGLTLAELVCFAFVHRGGNPVNLPGIVPCEGWKRALWWDQTGLPWVLPSPNMPTLDTATVYPGACLIEGTTLSEGRGTTRPFELFGAPGLDGTKLAEAIGPVPGAILRPLMFKPTFQKHAGQVCGGVQIHVTDRAHFRSWNLMIHAFSAILNLWPDRFGWRTDAYEFVREIPAFDLLAGSSAVREALEHGVDPDELIAEQTFPADEWRQRCEPFRLYE
ncbi:DUF1343 domain-containing protein [Myxococcota bacterium]|nr:DUF1343 domain-containing protein [Myxococcota bacterium]MBU1413701.1 DUF1343 domain-containing protein [Myxococcota bacterium]MBU1511619.1 DUF1343 domain-containing protein [Myxococcota bacterium]